MTEQRLRFIDIEPKPNSSDCANKPLWTRSDNTFRFNFLSNNCPAPQETAPQLLDRTEPKHRKLSFTGEGSAFAFNFEIPAVPPLEDMETAETVEDTCPGEKEENPSLQQDVKSPLELSEKSTATKKKNKKKKSGKQGSRDQEASKVPTAGSQLGEDTELSAEEQFNRQLDWCIEQLELGMRSQKGTPKQKEEASCALKTLRSSKAPLVKKRQVMRAMAGEYRQTMQEEKNKQLKLIKSEIASAQVKVVSDFSKKSVFHRRAAVKDQTPAKDQTAAKEDNSLEAAAQDSQQTLQTQGETLTPIFTPSKEEFRFNFL